ncbi:Major facilitator superfamily domain, general substrate transporter [Penicillium occitanis (nom. inval.)]|nr:Major facilitator superfamily domain, general substrate transporter [Penicillium occitanis (nom. inval.)]PCH00646.1 hypothetical protein PENOC_052330 [Penicillium occitanis (nom. inval.)]
MSLKESQSESAHTEHLADSKACTAQEGNAHEGNTHSTQGWFNWLTIGYMIIIALSMGLYGYDNNFASPLFQLPLFIERYQGPGLTFTARNLDLMAPVPLVGAVIGTFIAPNAMRRVGRKKTMIAAYALLCIPGSFLQLFAPNLGALVAGRFWNYIGISILTTSAPLYLAEFVPASFRGRAIGLCFAGTAAVGVIATTVVWATEKINDKRQYMIPLAIQAALPAILCLLTLFLPESPVWDIQHGHLDSARRTLLVLRNNRADIADAEIAMYLAAAAIEQARQKPNFWRILDLENLPRTLAAGTLLCSSQVGGQILVLTYATVILVASGVGNAFQITVIISCLQFLGTLIGPFLVDRVGRRPVALVGFSILLTLDLAAGSLGAVGLTSESQRLALAAIFILFGFFNAVSFQSLCYVLPTEIASPALREPTLAWAVFWSYITAVITTFAVPQLMNADAADLGVKTAYVFAGCVFVTLIWTYFYMPETMGRTVAEIDEMYRAGVPMRKWRGYRCEVLEIPSTVKERSVRAEEA